MVKKLLLGLLISGCATSVGTTAPDRWYSHPDRIKCPNDYFAYCEGRQRSHMECVCLHERELRQ